MRGAAGGTFEETCRARGVALTVGVYRSVSKIGPPRPSRNGRWLVPSQQQYLATRQGQNSLWRPRKRPNLCSDLWPIFGTNRIFFGRKG